MPAAVYLCFFTPFLTSILRKMPLQIKRVSKDFLYPSEYPVTHIADYLSENQLYYKHITTCR